METENKQVQMDGKTYSWNGTEWFDSKTRINQPAAIASKLSRLLNHGIEYVPAAK